jgi:hypothetical protein
VSSLEEEPFELELEEIARAAEHLGIIGALEDSAEFFTYHRLRWSPTRLV